MKVIDFRDASCRHCYKCVRNCSVKAISVKNAQAHIITENCIHCGHCLEVCPQNAKTFSSDMGQIRTWLRNGERVVVSMAPSYLSVLDYEKPGQVVDALMRLGFSEVRETAEGAAYVTREYQKLIREGAMKNIITTCCPSVNDLIEKYYPSLTPLMAPVVSPMIAHGRLIKKIYGDPVKTVFLGPCIAKKAEAEGDERVTGAIDGILTFDELVEWLAMAGIRIRDCKERLFGNPSPEVNRLYPVSGGILKSVLAEEGMEHYRKIYVDGLNACMELFESMEQGELEGCFLEVNICEGGCIKGPASHNWNHSFVKGKIRVESQVPREVSPVQETPEVDMEKHFYDRRIKEPVPTEAELTALLRAMGKYTKEDELNCGACGYPSCRAKAEAVYRKKAEISMCLPYALAQAESMSNVILDATPNLNFVVDRELRIRECNKKAQEFLKVSREEALESYIFEYIDEEDVTQVFDTGTPVIRKKLDLKDLGIIALETVVYIEKKDCVLVILQDVSKEEKAREQRFKRKLETMEIAQQVINKQMMVAQEIAGLLGETTAETKVTLTKLRDSVLLEDEGE